MQDWREKVLHPLTLREIHYKRVLNEILNKPFWWVKLSDPQIRSKWRAEALASLTSLTNHPTPDTTITEFPGFNFTPKASYTVPEPHRNVDTRAWVQDAVEFLFMEVENLAGRLLETPFGIVSHTSAHGVYIFDCGDLQLDLQRSASAVESDALAKQRWHYNSSGKVLDLFHPSDYCVVFGKTVLSDVPALLGSAGTACAELDGAFQWLPAEFSVASDYGVTAISYINNLHVSEKGLYADIEHVLARIIPIFEYTLGSYQTDHPERIPALNHNSDYQEEKYSYMERVWRDYLDGRSQSDLPRSAIEDFEKCLYDVVESRSFFQPGFKPFAPEIFRTLVAEPLRNRNLQVIVKMANTHLTPENPVFDTGEWHLEGEAHEHIVATAVYYYSSENITESRISFMNRYDPNDFFEYNQDDYAALENVYGFTNYDSQPVQMSGQVSCLEGRCVVFPNYMQHRVESFELLDKTKPGHRKILVFFLIHPDEPILSSLNVPMQQKEWVVKDLYDAFDSKLPVEIVELIVEFCQCTFSESEAQDYARLLSDSRSASRDSNGKEY